MFSLPPSGRHNHCVASMHFFFRSPKSSHALRKFNSCFCRPAEVFPVSTLIDIAPLGRHIRCVVSIYNAIIVFARLGRLICCANSIHFFVFPLLISAQLFIAWLKHFSFFRAPWSPQPSTQCQHMSFSAPLGRHSQCVVSTHVFSPPSPWSPQPMRCFNTCFAAPDI